LWRVVDSISFIVVLKWTLPEVLNAIQQSPTIKVRYGYRRTSHLFGLSLAIFTLFSLLAMTTYFFTAKLLKRSNAYDAVVLHFLMVGFFFCCPRNAKQRRSVIGAVNFNVASKIRDENFQTFQREPLQSASLGHREITLPSGTAARLAMELAMHYLAALKLRMAAACAASESASQITVGHYDEWAARSLSLTLGGRPIRKLCRLSLGFTPDPAYVVIDMRPVKMTGQLVVDSRGPGIEFSSSDEEEDLPELGTDAGQQRPKKEEEDTDGDVQRQPERVIRRGLVDGTIPVQEEEEEDTADA
jgi:hypothetical protein